MGCIVENEFLLLNKDAKDVLDVVTCLFGKWTVVSGVLELAACKAGAGPERS